jgi:dual-specificity kinase
LPGTQAIIPQQTVTGQRFCDLIRRLLHFDPDKRLDVRTALSHPFFQLHIPLD